MSFHSLWIRRRLAASCGDRGFCFFVLEATDFLVDFLELSLDLLFEETWLWFLFGFFWFTCCGCCCCRWDKLSATSDLPEGGVPVLLLVASVMDVVATVVVVVVDCAITSVVGVEIAFFVRWRWWCLRLFAQAGVVVVERDEVVAEEGSYAMVLVISCKLPKTSTMVLKSLWRPFIVFDRKDWSVIHRVLVLCPLDSLFKGGEYIRGTIDCVSRPSKRKNRRLAKHAKGENNLKRKGLTSDFWLEWYLNLIGKYISIFVTTNSLFEKRDSTWRNIVPPKKCKVPVLEKFKSQILRNIDWFCDCRIFWSHRSNNIKNNHRSHITIPSPTPLSSWMWQESIVSLTLLPRHPVQTPFV